MTTPLFQTPSALLGLAQDMIVKGWQPVWAPARQGGNYTPLDGCTGHYPFPSVLPQPTVQHKLAVRPPLNVVMFDVDHYDHKTGMDTLDEAEDRLGDLPPTYRITARGYDNPSGRYLFRKPEDLDFTDSALAHFGHERDGKMYTDIEVVRTGHRFSWAPGDFHYKNNTLITCYDEYGDPCEIPAVDDIPELPEAWVSYLRAPIVPQHFDPFTRPTDAPEWWLAVPDQTLSSDAELASFAWHMLLSRVPLEDIWEQWQRVARADSPGWPWERKDFDRHVRSQAQHKAGQVLARQDQETEWFAGTGADLDRIAQQTTDAFNGKQELRAVVDPSVPFNAETLRQIAAPAGIFFDPEDPDFYEEDGFPRPPKTTDQIIRNLPEYDRLLWTEVARGKAKSDAAKILAGEFKGWEDISQLEDPAAPSLFQVTGKDSVASAVISERTVTVLSAKRAAGKTWVSSLLASQVMTAGGHVLWLDFERQPSLLNQKLRSVGIPAHVTANQLHYSSKLPPVDRMVSDIKAYRAAEGKQVVLVVDAFRALQGNVVPGSNANDGDAVETVYIEYLTPAVDAGATVILLDHIAKNGDGSTFGSERKESAADYVFRLEKVLPFTTVKPGFSSITCAKDRYGLIAEGDPVGYLWVPGDKSLSGSSVEQYPLSPALRNWSPADAEEERQAELSMKGQREAILTELVKEQPLRLSINKLAADAIAGYPELFGSESSTKRYVRDMITAGTLTKDQGNGKLDVPVAVLPEANPVLTALQGTEDHQDNL